MVDATLKVIDEFLYRHTSLFQDAAQGSRCQLRVQWNDAAAHDIPSKSLQNSMAAALPHLNEAQATECADGLSP